METVTRVLATTGEICLKGANRGWFERLLTENVRRALDGLPPSRITRPSWRVLIEFEQPTPFVEVARRLGTVFGLHAIMPVEHGGRTIDDVCSALRDLVGGLETGTFAVRCTRSDKRFPATSVDIEREVGGFVKDLTNWTVDLSHPQLVIRLLVDENGFWFWLRQSPGPGGMPIGVSGRGLVLLSGGIDSPVASYMMMKRGMRLDFVHFHSVPRTDPSSIEKTHELVQLLNVYQQSAKLVTVPLLPIQERIVAECPPELRVLLYRRFMLRLAQRLSYRLHSRALITGESLAQVASQTIENIAAVEAVTSMPVLRPLIGLDKQEIVAIARRAGTFELSIQPQSDCCSFLMPTYPATRSSAAELDRAESVLPVQELVRTALHAAEVHAVRESAAWSEIPLPPLRNAAA